MIARLKRKIAGRNRYRDGELKRIGKKDRFVSFKHLLVPLISWWKKKESFKERDEKKVELIPFEQVKYFSFISLSLIFFASLLLAWMLADNAKDVLMERSQAYGKLFADNLNRQVFLQFVLPTVVRHGHITLSDENQFKRLDIIVRNLIRGMDIQSVTIFDSKENIISYSTISERVGKRDMGGEEYERARDGEDVSVLISTGSLFNLLPWASPVQSTLKTYVPFRQEDRSGLRTGEIMGVIEVVQDLSGELRAIIAFQGQIILLSLTIMSVLFAILAIIVVRANRIMAARAREHLLLEEKLGEAQRLATLGKMVASVSHEIKNPLGIVRSTAEILSKRIARVAPGNEKLASIIIEETSRLDGIVREFLDFARPRELELKKCSINDLIQRVSRFMEPELEKRGVEIVQELDFDLQSVLMDDEHIYQVLFNIVYNGIQAMADGGILLIKTGADKVTGGVFFSVIDKGIGIDEEKMEHIFTPFFTDKNRGTGLGLAIVKNIIDEHEGIIRVDSRVGEGTVFTVIIPGDRGRR